MSAHLIDVSLSAAQRTNLEREEDFGAALANCALTWHRQPGESAALQAITSDTPTLLRADAAAVVTVSNRGTWQIEAAHGPVEMLEASLPGAVQPPIWTLAAADQQPTGPFGRWPPPAMLDHHAGMGSMICAPLGIGSKVFGTLLVLGFTAQAFTRQSAMDLTTLAIHASIAVAGAAANNHLREALASRDIIGQAKGILMHTRQLTAEQAFAELLRASQNSNTKLRRVAENLCRTGEFLTVETGDQ